MRVDLPEGVRNVLQELLLEKQRVERELSIALRVALAQDGLKIEGSNIDIAHLGEGYVVVTEKGENNNA